MRISQIARVTAAMAAMVLFGFETDNAFANSNSNTSVNSAPPSGSTGGSHSAPRGGTAAGAGPRINATAPWYNPGPHYHSMTSYGISGRTLSYPPVHGTMVPIQPRLNQLNRFQGTKSSESESNAVTRNHQSMARQTQPKAQFGNSLSNNLVRKNRLDPQTSERLRNWTGKIDSVAEARRNHDEFRRAHHDGDWWRHHCVAIIFFDFGWWGWFDGWWYPAWGYDAYSYYAYDQPIYGYDGLPPDEVVASVQSALQQLGYFSYAADGVMGPLTRAAIANYQRDHNLPITGDIDPPTLGSLGLTD